MPHPSDPQVKIILIAAVDRNGALGRDGSLPWKCPVDMRHFVASTLDKTIVMGRKTADGFAKPLRNRTNIVMTRNGDYDRPGFQACASVQDVMDFAVAQGIAELWIIGGGVVYAEWLPYADLVHLTEIDVVVPDADTWFPMSGLDDFTGQSVTTVEDPLVRFWTMQRDAVGTQRDMSQDPTVQSAVVMDLNLPVAFWTPDHGRQHFGALREGVDDDN